MRPISGTTRSNSPSQIPGEAGDFTASIAGEADFKRLIEQANTIPILNIFKLYNLRLDSYNRRTSCPFKSHKNGRETTPSFWYYPETNSFYCFGCNMGGKSSHGCEFVSGMEGISKIKAAQKILSLFGAEVDEDVCYSKDNFSERLEIMVDFSNIIRNFRQTNIDEKSQDFIEKICQVYDQHNLKRNLDNEALSRMIEELKVKINLYLL